MKLSSWKYISIQDFNYKGGERGAGGRAKWIGAWSQDKGERKLIEVKKENWYLVFPLQFNAVRPAS